MDDAWKQPPNHHPKQQVFTVFSATGSRRVALQSDVHRLYPSLLSRVTEATGTALSINHIVFTWVMVSNVTYTFAFIFPSPLRLIKQLFDLCGMLWDLIVAPYLIAEAISTVVLLNIRRSKNSAVVLLNM